MANGDDIVLTEAGALSAEEHAVREQAGTAAAEVGTEELAREYRADVEEQIYGDAGDLALTAVEGGLRGLSFGLSDVAFGDEETAARQRVNSTTALLSELGGAVGASVLSGGGGTAGTLARLTPQGRLSAMTARIVAGGGSSMASRAGRAAVAGAIEGAAGGAGNYLSRVALDEDAEFSAEALLSSAGLGAIVGGGVGGGTVAVQSLGDVVAGKLADGAGLGRLVADAPRPAGLKRLNYRQILGKPKAERFADDLAEISRRVDDAAGLAASKELDDILSSPQLAAQLGDQLPAMRSRVAKLVEEQQQSAAIARDWATRYADALGVQDLASARRVDVAKVWAKEIPEELDELGPRWLAQLDEDTARLTAVRNELQAMATGAAPRPGVLGRIGEAATTVAGGLEFAQDLGIGGPSLRNIPGIGPALSAFVRLRAGARALQGAGLVPATRAAQSAATVTSVRDRIATTVGSAIRRASRSEGLRRAATTASKKVVARQIRELAESGPAEQTGAAEAERGDAGPVVGAAAAAGAARAKAYLQARAPQNPMAGSIWADTWEPTEQQARDWARRTAAVRDPLKALRTIMDSPFATLEAEAFREVYPAMWSAAREQVIRDAERLARNLAPAHAMAVGRAFDVPLHPFQLPGAMALQPQTPAMAPLPPNFGAPSVANTSPLVQDSETAAEARMRARA